MVSRLVVLWLFISGTVFGAAATLWQPYWITPRTGANHLVLAGPWELGWRNSAIEGVGDLSPLRWIKARVPGSVQWSLYDSGEFPHPYYNLNAKKYAWVDEKVWYYRTTFDSAPRDGFAFLCFDGVDHYSRVWLNGTELGQHEGMFGGPVIEVGRLLRRGEHNSLVVEVRAANWGAKKGWHFERLGRIIKPWVLSGGLGAESFFVLGIWRPVRLEFVPSVHLERPRLITRRATRESASLDLQVELLAGTHSLAARLHPWGNAVLNDRRNPLKELPLEGAFSVVLEMTPKNGAAATVRRTYPVRLHQGRNWAHRTISIANPRLWWPNGMGRPDLYRARVSLLREKTVLDQAEFDFGIRTFETLPTAGPRTQDRWANWQFAVNGRKFFAKGVNWMPADILLDLNAERYRWLLETVRAAGIQIVRVWGGGLIETNEFYQLADELGILVWQDFPIGNQDTPLWPQDIWEAQVMQNVFRLRNHPSLAIWCGGNEFNAYSIGNAASIGIVERSVRDFDGSRPLLRTSPDGGSIHTYPDMDPAWYGRLYSHVPFIAETGIHSIPAAATMREVVAGEEINGTLGNLYSKEFAATHPDFVHHFVEFQASRVPRMLSRASHIDDMSAPTLEALADASQIGAGEFYQIVSDTMQSNYPDTAGILPWVFKRPWPAIGVMLVDGFGQPSAPYYFLKRTYEPLHVAVALPYTIWGSGEQVPLSLRIMNAKADAGSPLAAIAEIFDPQLRSCWRRSGKITPGAAPSVTKLDLGSFAIPGTFEEKFFFVVAELRTDAGAIVSRSVYWPRCLREMRDSAYRDQQRAAPQPFPSLGHGPWLKPQASAARTRLAAQLLAAKRTPDGENHLQIRISNTGTRPAFMTHLDVEGRKHLLRAEDNFFWLAAGEQRDIELRIRWRDAAQSPFSCSVRAWNADPVVLTVPE